MFLNIRSGHLVNRLGIGESKDVLPGTAYLIPLEWRKSEEQPHQTEVCCRAGDEAVGLGMEEERGEVSISC